MYSCEGMIIARVFDDTTDRFGIKVPFCADLRSDDHEKLRESTTLTPLESTMPIAVETETFESRELFRRAEIQINRGRFREASAILAQALKMAPDNPIYVSHLGYCVGMLGNLPDGEKMCRRAMKMAPTVPIILVNLGRMLVEKGLRQEARILFTQAYQIDNTSSPAALELSRLGVRKPPILPFLGRENPLNKYLGILRYRLGKLFKSKNNEL